MIARPAVVTTTLNERKNRVEIFQKLQIATAGLTLRICGDHDEFETHFKE